MKKCLLLLILCATAACTEKPPADPTADGRVNPTHSIEMDVVTPGATSTNASLLGKSISPARNTLRISHAMLGKPMIYMLGEIEKRDPRLTNEYWDYNPYLPRLVNFTSDGHTIYLTDILSKLPFDTQSQATHKTIAVFPILSDDGKTIEFDFVKGMETLASWYSQFNWDDTATPAPYSTILASTSTNGSLLIDQQIQFSPLWSNSTWILRHVFSTTLANSNLEPRKPDETGHVGYFTTAPWYSAGNSVPHEYIQRWSLDRPIRFAISANTPAKFHDALAQGILDWNQAFGKEVLVLVDAPANMSPLDPAIDLGIHWVQSDNRALAYATPLPHPMTGQMIHGDVVIFSGYVKSLQSTSKMSIPDQKTVTKSAPDGFLSSRICERDNSELMDTLEATPELVDNETLREKFLQNSFRVLIRHEVGHILGLRHNFAGNLGATMDDKAIKTALQDFLSGKEWPVNPDLQPSSSEMDYLPWIQELFMPAVASYDLKAIQWGYFSKIGSIPDEDTPPFCTDQSADTKGVADCIRYDGNQDPLSYLETDLVDRIALYVKRLLKITTMTQTALDKISPTNSLPSVVRITKIVTDLNHYLSPDYSVRSINGMHALDRRANAKDILDYYYPVKHWGTPELISTVGRLKQMVKYGSADDANWAYDVLTRIKLGVGQLKSVLDASDDVSKNSANGATADIDFGN